MPAASGPALDSGIGRFLPDVPPPPNSGSAASIAPDLGTKVRDIRVQIVPKTITVIGAPMAGQLSDFPFRDGDRFKKGDILAHFNCAMQEATVARAQAELEGKRRVFETNEKLRQLGSSSGMDFGVAEAQMHGAAAELAVARAVVDRCTVRAPFTGRVSAAMVHEHQSVAESTPMLEILSDRELELQLIVPSPWLTWLKVGTLFQIAVLETGRTYKAELTRLSGKVDAASQSINVYGVITDPTENLLPGMSGRALFTPPAETR